MTNAVREAIQLREVEDPTPRDDVEAWLLCGLSPAEVAQKTDLEPAVVAAYRDLYFDVAGWLVDDFARTDLAWHLLGKKLHRGIAEADTRGWKVYTALYGGPYILGRLLDYFEVAPVVIPGDLKRLSDADLERLRDLLRIRWWLLTDAPLTTPAQRVRFEFVWAIQPGQRIWPANMR